MKYIITILICLFSIGCTNIKYQPTKVTSHTIYQSAGKLNIYSKNFTLDGKEELQFVGGGSGFSISKREIMTANHVCDAVDQGMVIRLAFYDKTKMIEIPHNLIPVKRDKEKDLCILHTYHNPLKPMKIASKAPEVGDRIRVFGSPHTIALLVTEGFYGYPKVFNVGGIGKMTLNTISAGSAPGNSGGPIINFRGEVVGVLTAGYEDYHHLCMTPTFSDIKEFLKGVL